MAITYNPRIVTDGLVLCLDPGNVKGYDKYENLTFYSSQIGIAGTYAPGGIVGLNTSATTAPNGLYEASFLDNNGNTATNYTYGGAGVGLSTNTTYTYSIHIKQGTKPDFQITIDENGFGGKRYYSIFTYSTETVTSGITGGTNDGVVVGSSVTKYSNGWYRLSLTFRTSTVNVSGFVDMINRFGNTSGSNYVWGRQLERGIDTTDYYPITGGLKIRGTTLSDLSGRGNNGTLTNGPTFSSANGGSIVFDAVDDRFSGSFVCNKTYYSVDFWCYPTALTDYNWAIGFNSFWGDFGLHTTVSGGVYVGTSVASRISPWRNNVFVLNTWQNFTWTFDNGTAKFYKNGVLETSANLALSASTEFTSYNGGGGGAASNCTGRLSIFKVYSNKVLTATEITQNFNALRGRFGI